MRVWVTRAEPGASATAGRLGALDHRPLVAPLLAVGALTPPDTLPERVGVLAFTSANGVAAYAALSRERRTPVFAVGEATAEAARAAGFRQVVSADGDVAALAALIVRRAPAGRILHPCGRERAGDLRGRLEEAGLEVATLPLYETRAARALPPAAALALEARALDAVLLHSPKAARTLAVLLTGVADGGLDRMRAIGLSAACVEPLRTLGFGSVESAARPDEASLLDRLQAPAS